MLIREIREMLYSCPQPCMPFHDRTNIANKLAELAGLLGIDKVVPHMGPASLEPNDVARTLQNHHLFRILGYDSE